MKIIRLKQVMETTGLARSTIYKFIAAGTFPKSVPLGGKSVGWVDEEIQEWVKAKIEERDAA
jgi:prophage regulatory protein